MKTTPEQREKWSKSLLHIQTYSCVGDYGSALLDTISDIDEQAERIKELEATLKGVKDTLARLCRHAKSNCCEKDAIFRHFARWVRDTTASEEIVIEVALKEKP